MAWVFLIIAGLLEWGWPVGLKLGLAETGLRWGWKSHVAGSRTGHNGGGMDGVAPYPIPVVGSAAVETVFPDAGSPD